MLARFQTELQAPANVRLVIIHYYPQDSTLEMLESKETAAPGVSRSFALRRPSRVSLDEIRVGSSVLVSVGHLTCGFVVLLAYFVIAWCICNIFSHPSSSILK